MHSENSGVFSHAAQVKQGERFEFGKNWERFLQVINEERIFEAEKSLRTMLEIDSLDSKTFLDVGSGSGLFSLAAARLGAARVHSLDYDPQSVASTRELKRRHFAEASHWTIEQGDSLDSTYLARLGQFDIVYSWGVLHHTGNLWQALANMVPLVVPGGKLCIAIYNDAGSRSRTWRAIKSTYNKSRAGRACVTLIFIPYSVLAALAADVLHFRNPLSRYLTYSKKRGMSVVRDWFDWLGGYPYEFAQPGEITDFYCRKGFQVLKVVTPEWRLGNNEYVFLKQGN